ncbi:MAG TPA: DUF4340 domain-containing protein [Pirellulales bacterium]|jgi:hypothetical protein|nr:DUF4340 domain-containing protein [Pirellulales bacterium]
MSDAAKTLSLVAVAAVLVAVAFATHPRPIEETTQADVGKPLYPQLDGTDPLNVKGLEILKFNEDTAELTPFTVKQVDNRWVISSNQNYPADAKSHMADAAAAVMDLKIEDRISKDKGDQAKYGVVEPDPNSLQVESTGVGERIKVTDGKGHDLATFIIGKPFKEGSDLHYVRRAGDNNIFLVSIHADKFSSRFGEWIEKNLLGLNPANIAQVEIRDYVSEAGVDLQGMLRSRQIPRATLELGFDNAKSAWSLLKAVEFNAKKEPTEFKLTADEELNVTKLNDMKNAFDDLKIVDVERKPAGLEGDLMEFLKTNEDAAQSLFRRGFYPAVSADGKAFIRSSDGEVVCRLNDGVEYVLRFGKIAGQTEESNDKDAKKEAKAAKKDKTQVSRYIFVMAQLNESMIPKPMLEIVPGEAAPEANKPDEKKPDEKKPAETKPDASQPEAGKADEKKPDASQPDAGKSNDKKPNEKSAAAAGRATVYTAADADDKGPAAKPDAGDKHDTDLKAGDKPAADHAETKKDETKKDDTKKDQTKQDDTKKDDQKGAAQAAERERIIADNKRKQSVYDDQVKKAEARVKDLNKRFGQWYYVVGDDEYKKIHLSQADVIKQKEKPKGQGNNPEDFHELEKGLKGLPPVPNK